MSGRQGGGTTTPFPFTEYRRWRDNRGTEHRKWGRLSGRRRRRIEHCHGKSATRRRNLQRYFGLELSAACGIQPWFAVRCECTPKRGRCQFSTVGRQIDV